MCRLRVLRSCAVLLAALLLGLAGPARAQQSLTVSIEPLAGSTVRGSAVLVSEAGGARVSLELAGLRPGASYPARLQAGSCAQPSASFASLPTLAADAGGRAAGSALVLFRGSQPVPLATLADGEHVILLSLADSAVACGPIPRLTAGPPAQLPTRLPATGQPEPDPQPALLGLLGLLLLAWPIAARAARRH